MKKIFGLCGAIAALVACAGCADEHYAGGASVGVGVDAVAVNDCDGFYDDSYGPFVDGCWADDGVFWYRDRNGDYHRDVGHHFSHTQVAGMHSIHGTGPGAGAHFGAPKPPPSGTP